MYLDYNGALAIAQVEGGNSPVLSTNCIDMREPVNLGAGANKPKLMIRIIGSAASVAEGVKFELIGGTGVSGGNINAGQTPVAILELTGGQYEVGDIFEIEPMPHEPRRYFQGRIDRGGSTGDLTFDMRLTFATQQKGIMDAHQVRRPDLVQD